ncbi:MAG: hypothetical protein VW741_06420 [Flammeovirgaceae bacterium]
MGVISWILVFFGFIILIQSYRAFYKMWIASGEEKITFLDIIIVISALALFAWGGMLLEEGNLWGIIPMSGLIALRYDWFGRLYRFFKQRKYEREQAKKHALRETGKKFLEDLRKAPYNNDKVGKSFVRKVSKKENSIKK